jgi:hypothetical protein
LNFAGRVLDEVLAEVVIELRIAGFAPAGEDAVAVAPGVGLDGLEAGGRRFAVGDELQKCFGGHGSRLPFVSQ